jgi:predicted DCC family thiol-disulfide oxidoreductase YuxK
MPILFYDANCGLCARSVQWVLAHEQQKRTLRFASLQGAHAAATPGVSREAHALDSVIWYEEADDTHSARLWTRSAAVLEVWRYIGGAWQVPAAIGRLLPRAFRDWLYDLIARHRHALAGPACVLPTPEQRERFLDER